MEMFLGTNNFLKTKEIILKRKENQPRWKLKIGKIREQKVEKALFKMKRDKEIINFLSSGNFSYPDVIDGIDFYIIFINKRYRVIPLSVTGPDFVEDHRVKHPEVPIIAVKLSTPYQEIRERILEIIHSPL